MTHTTETTGQVTRDMRGYPYVDIVDFVERTTYEIWNDRKPELVPTWYGPHSIIRSDSGDLIGGEAVTADTREQQATFPDYRGVIHDTIWTGDDTSGYRTSMRWIARGTYGGGSSGSGGAVPPTGPRVVHNSCIANCVVLGDQYVEEWSGANPISVDDQLAIDATSPMTTMPEALQRAPVHAERTWTAQDHGATVPAIPATVDGAGLFVVELLHDLYDRRDLDAIPRRYAPGAPYSFGVARWQVGHDGVRSEVGRWLDLLPDATATVDELYWLDEKPGRARVAVRFRVTGTARPTDGDGDGAERPVEIMAIHHVHVRGDRVVAEWAEYDELALRRQLAAG